MAKLVFHNGPYKGKSVGIPQGKTITIGRNRDLEMPLPDLKLSRRHCQISFKDDHYTLTDLGSTNGTFVNGDRISGEVPLNDFDRVVVGDTEIEFHSAERVPLPLNFDSAAADPFGLDADDNEVPLDELRALDEALGAGAAAEAPVFADSPQVPAAAPSVQQFAKLLYNAPPPIPAPVVELAAPAAVPQSPVPMPALPELAAQPPSVQQFAKLLYNPLAPAAEPSAEIPSPIAAAAPLDPLEAALRELDQPLPPEPPPLAMAEQAAARKPKLLFCVACEGSIPMLDYDLGVAREVAGQLLCGECFAKGVQPPRQAPETERTIAVSSPQPAKKSVSDILKALDEEAVIIDTSLPSKRAGHAAPQPDAAKPKAPAKDIADEFGEEFEEIH